MFSDQVFLNFCFVFVSEKLTYITSIANNLGFVNSFGFCYSKPMENQEFGDITGKVPEKIPRSRVALWALIVLALLVVATLSVLKNKVNSPLQAQAKIQTFVVAKGQSSHVI